MEPKKTPEKSSPKGVSSPSSAGAANTGSSQTTPPRPSQKTELDRVNAVIREKGTRNDRIQEMESFDTPTMSWQDASNYESNGSANTRYLHLLW
ncbi:hypothetical protein N7490_002661 [Penicillium lividum]|nr:hypothetical protein N7490_002661 [Penicillium lividum]